MYQFIKSPLGLKNKLESVLQLDVSVSEISVWLAVSAVVYGEIKGKTFIDCYCKVSIEQHAIVLSSFCIELKVCCISNLGVFR